MKRLQENPIIILIGILASCISIFAFLTDINSIKDFFTPNETILAVKPTQPIANVQSTISSPQILPTITKEGWNSLLSVRKPTLNEIRADDPPSLWVTNNIEVRDMSAPGLDQYTGEAEAGREYLLPVYWCAKSSDILQQNMDNIITYFTVNDEVVPEKYIFNYNYDTSNGWKCSYHAVVFGNWDKSKQYILKAHRNIQIDLSDGQSNYTAGEYIFALQVSIK